MMTGIQVLPETIKSLISQNTAFDSVVEIYLAKKHRKYALAERNSLKRKWENFFERRESLCRAFFLRKFRTDIIQALYRYYFKGAGTI